LCPFSQELTVVSGRNSGGRGIEPRPPNRAKKQRKRLPEIAGIMRNIIEMADGRYDEPSLKNTCILEAAQPL
jgi:hypothetical protein